MPKKIILSAPDLDTIVDSINEGIYAVEAENIRTEDIRIWIPLYFNSMLLKYVADISPVYGQYAQDGYLTSYRGVKVLEGYENDVIIGFKDAALYDIAPKIVRIP